MSADQNAELIPVEDLQDLFEPRRPDAESFRAGVEERIAERERAEKDEGAEGFDSMSFMKRAAAVLPTDPVGGSKTGPALLKFSYATLALPALVLASSIGSFFASARAVKREMEKAEPADPAQAKAFGSMGMRALKLKPLNRDLLVAKRLMVVVNSGLLLALFLSFLTGGRTAMDALTGVLLLAMGMLVLAVRGLGQAGLLSRNLVGRFVFSLLSTVYTGCFLWFSTVLAVPDGGSTLGVPGAISVVFVGLVVAAFLNWGWVKSLLAVVVIVGLSCLTNPFGLTKSSPAAIRNYLESAQLDPTKLEGWEGAGAMFTTLRAIGEELPDLSRTADVLATAIDEGVQPHPVVWTAAWRMELIDSEQWSQILEVGSEQYSQEQVLREDTPMTWADYDEYRIPLLLATRELSSDDRDRLAENALAAWPEAGQHDPLSDVVRLVRTFEMLGREDLIEQKRAAIRELLVTHWVAPGESGIFGGSGGFTPNPLKFDSSFVEETWNAIGLMIRVGVPEPIELRQVRGYLKNEARALSTLGDPMPRLRAQERAALLRLDSELGMPERSLLQILLAERLFIATLLLVSLCLMAIRLAPPMADEDSDGSKGAKP